MSNLTNNTEELQNILEKARSLPEAFSGSWNDLTDKPASFTPAAHNHNASDINAGTLAIDRLPLTELATSLGAAQIATGSFNGTGKTSFSITFPFVPKFVFMHSEYNSITIRGSCVYIGGTVAGGSYYNGTNVISANVTVSGTTLTFKEGSGIESYINSSGYVVRWAAFA